MVDEVDANSKANAAQIEKLQVLHGADIEKLQIRLDNLRDRVEILRGDLKDHEAAHMLAGERLDRPRRGDD